MTEPNRLHDVAGPRAAGRSRHAALPLTRLRMKLLNSTADQQHRAEEDLIPVLVDVGVGQADHDHPEDDRSEEGADDRPESAGQQAAADDGGDDRFELFLKAAPGIRRAGIEHRENCDQRRAAGRDMNRIALTSATGTPELRAASASPPEARIQFPKRVRARMKAPTATAANHKSSTGRPERRADHRKVAIQPPRASAEKSP